MNSEVKKYTGESFNQAWERVKTDLGDDALIVKTSYVKKGGIFGFGSSSWVEIEARCSESEEEPVRKKNFTQQKEQEKERIRETVVELFRQPAVDDGEDPLYDALIRRGLYPQLAEKIIKEAEGEAPRLKHNQPERALVVRDILSKKIPTAGVNWKQVEKKKPYVCVLVGPTGVGKTTTIAKLAARFKLAMNKQVGLLTLDTYRIGAVDQLRTYSEIIGCPLEVINQPSEISRVRQKFADQDIILVDTAGRSQRDTPRMEELNRYLDGLKPDEIHLVVSATTNLESLQNIIQHFRQCRFNRIIFTKLDEANVFGHLVSAILEEELLLSYLTHGQEVPDDLAEAKGENIAALIAGTGV